MDSAPIARVCISLCEDTLANLKESYLKAAESSDWIELRLDCLSSLDQETVFRFLRESKQRGNLILTLRPEEQGGRRSIDAESRLRFWTENRSQPENFIDVELDLVDELRSAINSIDWGRVICSHHDFSGAPDNLNQIYDRLRSSPARVLKLSVQAADLCDCIPLFKLLERAREESRELIPIAMGNAGVATRILGQSRGAFLTYGSLDNNQGTAPGQISVRDLRDLYRIDKINSETRIYGVMGYPIGHSLSPQVHNAAFAAAGLNAVYIPFEVRNAREFLTRMVHPKSRELDWNLSGLSVTAPHKVAVMEQLDWIEPAAREIGAVNTIVVEGEKLLGYNTDAAALVEPLLKKFGPLRDARVAVIGAGGVAVAAVHGLREAGAITTVFARDAEKGRLLANKFRAKFQSIDGAAYSAFDVVINTTSLGMAGVSETDAPATADQLRGARLAYDLVYNPIETRFLLEAKSAGCETLGGLEMFVAQAAEQFRLWMGVDAPGAVMNAAAEAALEG
ncbi:MAG TPA: shikimate dehydrogenase [Pyrinomonadaceae bacterium]|nr:shikimate dehydrogenase [Pyrinomonadaceae bacterium]